MKKIIYFGLCLLTACSSPDLNIQTISRENDEIKKEGREIYYNENDTTVLKYYPGLSYFNSFDSNSNTMVIINDRRNSKHYTIYFGDHGINGINYSSNNENTFYVNEKNIGFLKNIFNENRTKINNDSLNKIFQEISAKYSLEEMLK